MRATWRIWLDRLLAFMPTRRLAAVVALLAPVWLLSGRAPGHAGGAVVALVLVVLGASVLADALATPAAWQIEVERRLPGTVGVGEVASGAYRLLLHGRSPRWIELFDALPPAAPRTEPAGGPRRLTPGEALELPLAVTGRHRGVHSLGPIALRVRGPLGLITRTLRYAPGDAITVAPALAGARRLRLAALHERLRQPGARLIRRRGASTSYANMREYVTGDDPRHIDWKVSARRGRLVTREYAAEQGQTVMIAIDAGRLMTQLDGPMSRFEYALSSAMVLADVAVHSGDRVGAIVFDDAVRAFVPATRGREAVERIRRALIPAAATMTEPDYASAFRTLAARHRKRSLVVIFTDVIDPRASQALITYTGRSAMHHLVLVVALRNEELVAAALPTGVATTTALYESAAAEELVMARNDALQRMRQAGVSVIDVSPRAMTAAVVNRYLELKARGAT